MQTHKKPASSAAVVGGAMLALWAGAGCVDEVTDVEVATDQKLEARLSDDLECDPEEAGITLPPGFCAIVVADLVLDGAAAAARHLAITPTGDVFVSISPRFGQPSYGIIGLRDTDGDGRADKQTYFSANLGGSGIAWGYNFLYHGANDRIVRYRLPAGSLEPVGAPAVLVSGLSSAGDHARKSIVLANRTTLFVNIGSPSNSCQEANRQLESPGIFPCPELELQAGIWRFDTGRTDQVQADGEHYATGYRNMEAIAVNPANQQLYGVQHGRDMLYENWPDYYTVEEDAVLPAEEFVLIGRGSNNGWPYCYYDAVFQNAKVLAPEYGGDGQRVSGGPGIDCASYNQPLLSFGAHWAPNGLHFYTGRMFPARYRGGAFVAFHGGFDRAPLPNEGYQVAFVPFSGGGPAGAYETFADGFAGSTGPLPATALHRPVGLTEGPDGSLYIAEDRGGRIYRVIYIED